MKIYMKDGLRMQIKAEKPELLEQAKIEHKGRVGEGYIPPIPKDVKPVAMDSFKK